MKTSQIITTVIVSFALCLGAAIIPWYMGDIHSTVQLSDHFFLSGILCTLIGMIMALVATSRRHYYKHIQNTLRGKVENDTQFNTDETKRKKHLHVGCAIAIVGIIVFLLSGVLALL